MVRTLLGMVVAVASAVIIGFWWRLHLSGLSALSLLGLLGGVYWLTLSGLSGHGRRAHVPSRDARPTLGGKPRGEAGASRASPAPGQTPRVDDDVWCTAFAPSTCAPGDAVLIQVFAHRRAQTSTVRSMAVEFDPAATARGATHLHGPVEREHELTFCLVMNDAAVEPAVLSLMWHGEPAAVQFSVSVPEELSGKHLIGTIYVTQGSVPCGHLKFVIHVAETDVAASTNPVQQPVDFKQYRSAFVSYASQDRTEVLKRVQMLPRLSIRFFQDLLSLDPGERWERALYRNIDDSDVFFLFWSTHAKNSRWVMREVHYAIQRKGGDEFAAPEIVPIIIEGPPPVPPPPSLAHLHFNDTFIYFMQSGDKPV